MGFRVVASSTEMIVELFSYSVSSLPVISFTLLEIVSTVIGAGGLRLLALWQKAFRPMVNVGVLSLCVDVKLHNYCQ
jgi:hypothetical protein